jgi:hypothetical protein
LVGVLKDSWEIRREIDIGILFVDMIMKLRTIDNTLTVYADNTSEKLIDDDTERWKIIGQMVYDCIMIGKWCVVSFIQNRKVGR